ncbi:MAG: nucleoside-diphosphate sugar epimerase/dehydratase [Nostocaceae cyanobacterium]|nr:nucleoside-diphosphate sugar epimerase/dehydratase [Nostocaceae cyanobacterium]
MKALLCFYNWLLKASTHLFLIKIIKLRNRHWFIIDILAFLIIPFLALLLRHDGNFALFETYKYEIVYAAILFLTVKVTVLWCCGFYQRYWRYASMEELTHIGILMVAAIVIQSFLFDVISHIPNPLISKLPKSLPLIDGLLAFIAIVGLRFSVRVIDRICQKQTEIECQPQERVLIVGAGSAGVSLVEEMQRNPQLGFHPIAFIDDDPHKLNLRIRNIPVVGNRFQIPEISKSLHIHKAVIAMPTVAGRIIREILDICRTSGIQTNTLPGIHEILNGRVRLDSIRNIRIEDLLRREPVETEIEKVVEFLQGKKVLITGAGGSIGSELCRQICKCLPAEMMLLGHGENSIFNIQQELNQVLLLLQQENTTQGYSPNLVIFIADIRFRERLKEAFEQFRPDVIFHAAAHKHVPLMELNSPEAITNNVIGTRNVVNLAQEYNVKHLVMISTDKAVNPTNVMGASKRIAEMLVLQAARGSGNSYVAVRFGNVLGSRGSVVPTFQKQIAAGGPVTVTHPEIRRYFMTIPEAVQLVLQAAVLGHGGEVLMLNMGEPVKIVELAEELIRLSGYEVNKDIEIAFTGLRPGEKLFEELLIEGEEYEPTEHEKLFVVKNASGIIPGNLGAIVDSLCKAATKNDINSIRFLLEQIVPGYQPQYLQNNLPVAVSKNITVGADKNVVSILGRLEPRRV